MMTNLLPRAAALALAAVVAAAGPAFAQTFHPRPARPDWGIFASGVSNTAQRLVLTGTFGGGWDDDLTKQVSAPELPTAQPLMTGPYGAAGANLTYTVDKSSVRGGLNFGVLGWNYRDMTDPFVGTYSASGNLDVAFGETATLGTSYFAGQFVQNLAPPGYNPGTGWGMPGVPSTPTGPGTFTNGATYRGLGASAHYNHTLSRNLSAMASYSYYSNDSAAPADGVFYETQYANAGLRYALGKGVGLRGGYGGTVGGYTAGGAEPFRSRSIDVGVDYDKSLSLTRTSTLSFSTGLSGVRDQAANTHYYFIGFVNFTHEIGRSWSVWAGASRWTDFYQTLGQPTITNSVNGGLNGLVGRRVTLTAGVGAYQGSFIGATAQTYVSANAHASVQYAMNRVLAIGATYSFYHYGFNDGVDVPPGFVRQFDRQSVLVSLNVWAPLVTQARRANASR
jgi:hypothetical protein